RGPGLSAQVAPRARASGARHRQWPDAELADLRRILRRQTGVLGGTRRLSRDVLRRRNSSQFPVFGDPAARQETQEGLDRKTGRQPGALQLGLESTRLARRVADA